MGIVGYRNAVHKCSYLANVYGFKKTYEVIFEHDKTYDKYIKELEELIYTHKVKVFIGDTVLLNTLEKKLYYIDFYLIKSEQISVYKALEEAKKLLEFKESEKIKNRYMTVILNNTDCGMIYTDEKGNINHFNQLANSLFFYKLEVNINIFGFIKNIDKNDVFKMKEEVKNILINTDKEEVSLDITPILVGKEKNGFLFIFRHLKNIETSANMLRNSLKRESHRAKYTWNNIVTQNKELIELKKVANLYSQSDNSILITGETGTGKELFAQSIHNSSGRREEPFIVFNCANVSESLIESELFGYEEGAFTGARKKGKRGLFQLADRGTIFLDEISEIPYHLQNKFLRVLQEKAFRKVGGEEIIHIDIRVIAASNKNLFSLCEEKKFRSDLLYRLNVLEIETIPLRKRPNDIFHIGEYFLNKELENNSNGNIKGFYSLLNKLTQYHFPGNVRELENIVKRMVVLKINLKFSDNKILKLLTTENKENKEFLFHNMTLKEIEKKIVKDILEKENQNKTKAAIKLGIDRGTLARIIK